MAKKTVAVASVTVAKEQGSGLDQVEALEAAIASPEAAKPATFIAKKDFEIFHNGYHRKIQAGDNLLDVPELYHQNLKTEGVL